MMEGRRAQGAADRRAFWLPAGSRGRGPSQDPLRGPCRSIFGRLATGRAGRLSIQNAAAARGKISGTLRGACRRSRDNSFGFDILSHVLARKLRLAAVKAGQNSDSCDHDRGRRGTSSTSIFPRACAKGLASFASSARCGPAFVHACARAHGVRPRPPANSIRPPSAPTTDGSGRAVATRPLSLQDAHISVLRSPPPSPAPPPAGRGQSKSGLGQTGRPLHQSGPPCWDGHRQGHLPSAPSPAGYSGARPSGEFSSLFKNTRGRPNPNPPHHPNGQGQGPGHDITKDGQAFIILSFCLTGDHARDN